MGYLRILLCILPILFLSSCNDGKVLGKVDNSNLLTITNPNGTVVSYNSVSSAASTNNTKEAPSSEAGGFEVDFSDDGSLKSIKTKASGSTGGFGEVINIASNLFKWPMIFGGLALIAGIAVWWATPLKSLGLGLMGGGAAAMALSIVLAQYAWIVAIVVGLGLLGAAGYTLYKYHTTYKAVDENVTVIEHIRDKYMTEEVENKLFKDKTASVPTRQSKATQKIVEDIREKKGYKTK